MDKDAVQRTAKPRGNGTGGKKAIDKVQLNVRISATVSSRIQKLAKKTGRSIAWIVEHALCQTLEFNE